MRRYISSIIIIFSAIFVLATGTILAQIKNAASLQIVTPSADQVLYGDKVPILLSVENFELVDFNTNRTPSAGQGHIHLWLDEQNPTAESAVKLIKDNFTYSDVPFGNHTLRAELVNNNHSPLKPPVTTTINFKTEPVATPSPAAIVSGFDKNTAIVILVVVAIVIIAAWWYTKEEDEEELKATKVKKKKPARKKSKGKR